MGEIGKYIYGIIPRLRSGQVNSNTDSKISNGVYTIPYQDISAVVTETEIVDYTHMLKDAVARYLISHQRVIEKVMENFTIIPMRLGTFAVDGNEVRHILAKGYPIIKDIFNKIFDKIEIDVVCTWSDFDSVLKEVGEDKEIKEFKEKLLANPKGITVDAQLKVGVMVKKVLDEKRQNYASEIQDALKIVSQDLKVHELMDDEMVANFALLIDKTRQKDFDRKVEELNAKFAEKLNFRCVGPLPPYSFYTLEMKRMNFKEVDWARRRLGLNDFITKDEIKKAYQTKAFSSHPDKNPDTPGIEREFEEITEANKILLDYCQDEGCSFKEEDFRNSSLIVKVRE